MKRYLTILFFFLLSLTLSAQQPKMNVTGFRQSSEQTANLAGTMVRDNDGKPCALLRVQTTQKGFNWQFGQFNAVKVDENHTAEIWVYVPYGVKRCTIRHPQLGTCDYDFPMAVESAKTYRMDLAAADINVVVTQKLSQAYLLLKVVPSDPETHIRFGITAGLERGEMSRAEDEGRYSVFSERLDCGKYWYKVENVYYNSYSGTIEVSQDKENVQVVNLIPRFGLLTVITDPSGANVYLDNEPVGKSPCELQKRITPGNHTLRCMHSDYYPCSKTVTVPSNGSRIMENIVMRPQFAEVTVTAEDAQSEIWIDGGKVAVGKWTGRLSSKSSHSVECRRSGYYPQSKVIEVKDGVPQSIALPAPVPMLGTLDLKVVSDDGKLVSGAEIYVDGKKVGTTPYLGHILVGTHLLKIIKSGYEELKASVDIRQNKESSLSLIMKRQPASRGAAMPSAIAASSSSDGKSAVSSYHGELEITTNPSKAMVEIDGKKMGASPIKLRLREGKYKVRVSLNGYVSTVSTVKVIADALVRKNVVLRKGIPVLHVQVPDDAGRKADGKIDRHKYVDLGLSVKWATCNVGARHPDEKGTFFAFGDVVGQTWKNGEWSDGGAKAAAGIKYELDANGNLCPEYDAAHVNWGGSWRMPTAAEVQELLDNCSFIWEDNFDGLSVQGVVCRSKKPGYTDKYIFLPYAFKGKDGPYGKYWSSSRFSDTRAVTIYFDSTMICSLRKSDFGRFIRPVSK